MKKKHILRSLLFSVLAMAAAISVAVPAYATFIREQNPGGENFFTDNNGNSKVSTFYGYVGSLSGPEVKVSTTGPVYTKTGYAYADITPAGDCILLTDLIFTPQGKTKFTDFSFAGELELEKKGSKGDVDVKVTDQKGKVFNFDFDFTSKKPVTDIEFGPIGIVSTDGVWIKSVEIYTPDCESFKEVDNINFSVPEPSTSLLLGAGLGGLWIWRRRKLQ